MDLCSAENRSHLTLQFLRASIHGAAGRHIDGTPDTVVGETFPITQAKPESDLTPEERRALPKPACDQRIRKLPFPNVPGLAMMPQCLRGSKGRESERVS